MEKQNEQLFSSHIVTLEIIMGTLRFLLALSVVIAHSGPLFGFELLGGEVAVQSFYIVSGFYMGLILNEKYINFKGAYWTFISNRLLRLFPAYWLILISTIFYSIIIGTYSSGNYYGKLATLIEYSDNISFSSYSVLVFTNLFLVFQDLLMFFCIDLKTGLLSFNYTPFNCDPKIYQFLVVPHAWTLGIEILFYFIAPFIVRKSRTIISLLIASLILRFFIQSYMGLTFDPWSYRFFPCELVFFLMGSLLYFIYVKFKNYNHSRSFSLLIIALLILFIINYDVINLPYKFLIYLTLLSISIPIIFKLTKESQIDNFIGELSYPIYLSHILVLAILSHLEIHSKMIGLFASISTIAVSISINLLLIRYIENYRQRRILKHLNL